MRSRGVKIAGSYYCPHLPDGCVAEYAKECNCRKPKTGMYWQAARELGTDMKRSFVVGDRLRDLFICEESGVKGILLSDYGGRGQAYKVCADWVEAIRMIKIIEEQGQG